MNLTEVTYTVPERELSIGELHEHELLVKQSKEREKNSYKSKNNFKLYKRFLNKSTT